jgi:SAM-dependent methyltransferase
LSTLSEVEHFFDQVASNYDRIVGGNGWPANDILRQELDKIRGIDYALDLGAGTGLSVETILAAAVPRCVVAVDVSSEMLEQLRRRCSQHPELLITRAAVDRFLTLVETKITSTGIRARLRDRCNRRPGPTVRVRAVDQFRGAIQSRFDLVTAIGLLHFLPGPQPTNIGAARVLRNGGRFLFTYDPFISGHPANGEKQTTYDSGVTVYRSTPAEIERAIRQSGLKIVSDQLFVPQPNGNTEYRCRFVVAQRSISPAGTE